MNKVHIKNRIRQVNIYNLVIYSLITVAFIFLTILLLKSLSWRYIHDSPIMIYTGFLLSEGLIPYRDFFDMNMPGIYFIMASYGSILGWGEMSFRMLDLFCLTIIVVATFHWMKHFGRVAAHIAPIIFSLWYLLQGPTFTLQREFFALVLLSIALALSILNTNFHLKIKISILGVLAGLSVLIKPFFIIFFLPVLCLVNVQINMRLSKLWIITFFICGTLTPLIIVVIYLIVNEASKSFLDIVINYWPLYTQMTGDNEILSGQNRIWYIYKSTIDQLITPFLIFVIVGLSSLYINNTTRRFSFVFLIFFFISILYVSLAGKFWDYHKIPLAYISICIGALTSVLMIEKGKNNQLTLRSKLYEKLPLFIKNKKYFFFYSSFLFIVFFILSFILVAFDRNMNYEKIVSPLYNKRLTVPDEISEYLKLYLGENDQVQALDWTSGAIHGILLAKVKNVTRFIYDFHFYHHVDNPYIENLREELITELKIKRPKFIIQVTDNRNWPSGINTSQDFPELKSLIENSYSLVVIKDTYQIFEKKD